jgi:hypothetical protein
MDRKNRDFIRLLAHLAQASTTEPIRERACPYKGLEAFEESDVDLFFGRHNTTSILVEKVRAGSLVVVSGPSGSGKSSLVKAGLLPVLRKQAKTWSIMAFRLSGNPMVSLVSALSRLIIPPAPSIAQLQAIPKLLSAVEGGQLPYVLQQVTDNSPYTLLFIDQFEELYTLCNNYRQRSSFLDALVETATLHPETLKIVVSLRADFLNRVYAHRRFTDAIQDADVKVGPMTEMELTQVIEGPAALMNVGFEEGLVDRIVSDVGMEAGTLPLLEFALTRIWERRSSDTLTHALYGQVGQLAGAIANSAESMFRGMSEPEQVLTRRILSRLVRVADGGGGDTRQRFSLPSLLMEQQIGSDAGRRAIERLVTARLLVLSRDETTRQETVEVTHEALIRRWPRFRQWLQKDRELLVWRQRLDLVIREWKQSGRDDSFVLRGPFLDEAHLWLTSRRDEFTTVEQEFIEASKTAADRESRNSPIFTGDFLLRNDLGSSTDGERGTLLGVLREHQRHEWWKLRLGLIRLVDFAEADSPEHTILTSQLGQLSSTIPLGDRDIDHTWSPPDVLKGIKLDQASVALVRNLQRQAQTGAAVELLAPNLDKIADPHMRLTYASVLFDMLHIRGSYGDAASLIEQELSIADATIPANDHLLLSLRIRLIHYFMFYKPIGPLYAQMETLLRKSEENNDSEAYGEILFMLGGNLGVLKGSSPQSRQHLFAAIRHSIKSADRYLYCRCLRKYGDLLRARKHFSAARWVLGKGLDVATADQLRHVIYYLASLGDLERQCMNFAAAEDHFEAAIKRARSSFLPGWLGNLYLGLAVLATDKNDNTNAEIYLEQSESYYYKTKPRHVWGEVQLKLGKSRRLLKSGRDEWRDSAEAALELAVEFGYEREASFATQLLQTEKPFEPSLMFL